MALVVEFKPKVQGIGRRAEGSGHPSFTLLFFTGVRYERMTDDQSSLKDNETKNSRRASRRSHLRMKA